MVILLSTKCFLFVYMYVDLLKLKAYKLFENSDADLSWLLFCKEANLYTQPYSPDRVHSKVSSPLCLFVLCLVHPGLFVIH